MATRLGVISVNLEANIAKFQQDLQTASRTAGAEMSKMTATMRAESQRSSEALRLFGEGLDVRVSRPLAKVISQMQGLAPVLSAAFSIGATAAFAGLLVDKIVPALTKAKDLLLYTAPATDQAKPLEDLVKLQEKGVQLERTLAEIGKSQIEIMKLRVKWAEDELKLAHAKLDTDLKDAQAGLVIMQAHLAALSQAGGFGGVGVEAFVPKGTQEAADALQKKIDQITQTLKNLDTQTKIAGGNLKVALAEEAAKALTPLERMGLEIDSIGNRAKATLGKVQGLLPKDELQQMEDALKQINAELTAIENYKAGSPQKIFTDLNTYANKLLVAQQAITAEYDKQLQLLIQQGLAEAAKGAKFPEGVLAPPVVRIPVSPEAQSAADFVRIQQAIARVNADKQAGLITDEEARRSLEHLTEEWNRLAMQTDKTWAGINAGLREFSRQMGTLQQQIGFATLGALRNMHSSFTRFFTDIAMGTKGIGEAFAELGRNIVASIAEALAEMLANWIMVHVIMAAVSKIFGDDIGNAASQKQKNQQMASSDAFRAAAGTLALASENYLFPLPLILAAITLGVGQSFAAAAGKAKGGLITGSGFGDTVPAMLTPGEYVLSAPAVRGISVPVLDAMNQGRGLQRSVGAAVGGGGGGGTYNNYVSMPTSVSALDADGVDQVLNKHRTKIYRAMLAEIKKRGGGGFRN